MFGTFRAGSGKLIPIRHHSCLGSPVHDVSGSFVCSSLQLSSTTSSSSAGHRSAMHIGPNQVTTHEPTILPSDAEETNALRLHGRPLLIRGSVLSNFSEVLSGTWGRHAWHSTKKGFDATYTMPDQKTWCCSKHVESSDDAHDCCSSMASLALLQSLSMSQTGWGFRLFF
jgi:hypothetical protein